MNLINFYWFRRDLRLFDNAALHFSLKSDGPVLCLFIFDLDILDQLDDRSDARVTFIHQRLQELDRELKNYGSSLLVKIGRPVDVWKELLTEYNINGVFVNTDYEPYAGRRDKEIRALLTDNSVSFSEFKDQVIFEKNEVTKDDGLPYTVFTPYMKKWKGILTSDMLRPYNNADLGKNLLKNKDLRIPTLSELNFIQSSIAFPQVRYSEKIWSEYAEKRNIPHFDSTTKLSLYLRFGLVSIRELVKKAMLENETLLNEFIWREFFMQILWNFPHVADRSFRKKYDNIQWRNNEAEFERWCEGKTGFPLVDAGMRELNATGFMHNRVRMITASFLVKDLLIDWRWGEAYFAQKLLDYDLSANNGNWQWAAGSGCDAAPYFRIFNPDEQLRKFDKDEIYVRRWIKEYGSPTYPVAMVNHKYARERALKLYKEALS